MSTPAPVQGHTRRAVAALSKLAERDPAFAALALWIDHRDSDETAPAQALDGDPAAPAWTDGRTIWYGPAFETLPPDCQIGVAAHQILHVALRHPVRARAMAARLGPKLEPRLFNIAADALVNETLIAAGYALPRPCITLVPLQAFVLKDDMPAAQALSRWDAEALTLALLEAQAQGRTAAKGEGDAPAGGGAAEVEARRAGFAPDLDPSEGEAEGRGREAEEEAEWRQRLARALEEGRLAGRGIGALGFRLGDIPRSDVPWERHLRNLLARALSEEPRADWARPARRWVGMEAEARASGRPAPVYQPGRARARMVPRIALGLDLSSSVDDVRLSLFLAQIGGIARRGGAVLHLLAFDDAVRASVALPPVGVEAALRRLDLPRGGGTDYADLFAQAGALGPSAFVVLTDLDASVPPAVPGVPLIWAVPERPRAMPGHGKVLDLSL